MLAPIALSLSRFHSFAKYCPSPKSPVEDRGSPALGFSKAFNFFLPFSVRHLAAWPATLQSILENDAKSSLFDPCRNMFR